jgi:HEPN domain-containing protein
MGVEKNRDEAKRWLETGAKLDRYFIPTRYPNGLPELTPDEAYFEEDAQGALLLAQNLIDCVEKIFGAV